MRSKFQQDFLDKFQQDFLDKFQQDFLKLSQQEQEQEQQQQDRGRLLDLLLVGKNNVTLQLQTAEQSALSTVTDRTAQEQLKLNSSRIPAKIQNLDQSPWNTKKNKRIVSKDLRIF